MFEFSAFQTEGRSDREVYPTGEVTIHWTPALVEQLRSHCTLLEGLTRTSVAADYLSRRLELAKALLALAEPGFTTEVVVYSGFCTDDAVDVLARAIADAKDGQHYRELELKTHRAFGYVYTS